MVCGTALFGPPEVPIGMCLVVEDELDDDEADGDLVLELLELELPPIGPDEAGAGGGAVV